MLELVVLLTLIVVLLVVIYYKDKKIIESITEQFEDNWLDSCPAGYKTYYLEDGNVACCDGDIVANHCLGDSQCILTGNGTPEMPNCTKYIKQLYAQKSKELCPLSMTNYFENRSKKTKGCTSDRLNNSLSEPISAQSSKCLIYSTEEKNINSKDSCYNQKELDKFPCFGTNCKKYLTDTGSNTSPLITISFSDSNGILRVAHTKASMEQYLNRVNPNWREKGINLDKNISIAEVAKKFYIDRTIQQSELQL
jgi:hypothetical protein